MKSLLIASLVAAAALSQAGTLLGADDNRIYRIDLGTGVATSAGAIVGAGTGQVNALAYDAGTDRAYFQRGGKLWSMALATGAVDAVKTGAGAAISVGSSAAATFYNGSYYSMGQSDGKLYRTAVSGLVAGSAPALLADFANNWAFGDIATTTGGKLYGSSGNSVFSVDLNASPLSVTSESTRGVQTQLGFVGSTLYGVATGNAAGGSAGQIFRFDGSTGMTATGVVARYNGAALAINDAATYQPVPEPASIAALVVGGMGLLRRRRAA